jgi:FkbM family methyltransferase
MMVFLDVGAHMGQSLRAARTPAFGFDRIVCFEPSPQCWPELERVRDCRLQVEHFGLAAETGERVLYDPGSIGASVHGERPRTEEAQPAHFVRATDWFAANLRATDRVFMKMNCEGSEVDVLEDLLSSGEITKIASALVSFDVRKFPSQAHREAECKARLAQAGITTIVDARDVDAPSRMAVVMRWLSDTGVSPRLRVSDRLRYFLLPGVVRSLRLSVFARRVLPNAVYRRVRARMLSKGTTERGRPRS